MPPGGDDSNCQLAFPNQNRTTASHHYEAKSAPLSCEDEDMSDSDRFTASLGRVALADAEVDEWLVQVFIALLKPLSPSVVRTLVGSDNASQKASKLTKLLNEVNYAASTVGAQHPPVAVLLKRVGSLKERRDRLVHSFYDANQADDGSYRRFRSRTQATDVVTPAEIAELGDELEQLCQDLSALVRQLEHQHASAQDSWTLVAGQIEDCRELMVVSRLHQMGQLAPLAAAFEDHDQVTLAVYGYGRWRLVSDGTTPSAECPTIAQISMTTGGIRILTADGLIAETCDTGWRDVTLLARADSPATKSAFLRRVHQEVRYVQEGGEGGFDALIVEPDRLEARVFGRSSPWEQLPAAIRQLDGFRPADREAGSPRLD